jgi:hypothetical protein
MLDARGQIRLIDHAFSKRLTWPDPDPDPDPVSSLSPTLCLSHSQEKPLSSAKKYGNEIAKSTYESNIRAMKTFTLCGAPEYIAPGDL